MDNRENSKSQIQDGSDSESKGLQDNQSFVTLDLDNKEKAHGNRPVKGRHSIIMILIICALAIVAGVLIFIWIRYSMSDSPQQAAQSATATVQATPTPTATPTASVKATVQPTASDAYIIADSSERYLTASDVQQLTTQQLNYAKNEIYARHGRLFNSPELQNYFNSKSWYHGYISPADFSDSVFNTYENANIKLLTNTENEKGGYDLDGDGK